MFNIDLNNKIVLVTGGAGGIGSAISLTLARAGATLAVGFRTRSKEAQDIARTCGNDSSAVHGNLAHAEDCRRLIEETLGRYGRIDLLVNNTAVGGTDGIDMNYDEWTTHWNDTLNTNLMSAVNLSYWTIRHMKSRNAGKIINIASRSAFRGETDHIAYAVSKAGMISLTRCLARAHAKDGILVYAVAPGFIEAGMGLDGIRRQEEEIRSQIPSGKIGSAQDVANVVLFLASDLSNYITGSTLDVNGGSYLH